MKFSKYQQDIFQAIITTKSNIAVKASPGSGKTTSIVEAAKLIPYGKSSVFVAFNKSIVEELKSRLPKTTDCSTMHSIGFKAIANYYYMGKVILKESKQVGFIMPYFDQKNNREKWGAIYAVDRLITLARATMAKVSKEGMENVVRNYALDIEEEWLDKAVQALEDIYRYNDSMFRTNIEIDFQDMVELSVRNDKMRLPQYDYVFLDECLIGNTRIVTDKGKVKIESICRNIQKYKVKSLGKNGYEWKSVVNWWDRGERDVVEVRLGNKKKIRCTPEHLLLTLDGWKEAKTLIKGEALISSTTFQPYHQIISQECFEFLCGSALGDGSVNQLSDGIVRLRFIHGENQKEYLEWKARLFNRPVKLIKENGYSKKTAYSFATKGMYVIGGLNKEKAIRNLTPKALAISWMDDGSLHHSGCGGYLYATATSKRLSKLLAVKLLLEFKMEGIVIEEAKSNSTKKPYWYLRFNTDAIQEMFKRIAIYIHPSMTYKVKDQYKQLVGKYNWDFQLKEDNGCIVVSSVKALSKKEIVYDIEVEDNHNFLIASGGMLLKEHGVVSHNCQDMSAQDHIFLSKLVKPITGRTIGVGDEHQSIYGFRGSSPDSFDRFASQPNTITLPLSISYRCPKAVVREAAKVYSDIEPYVENEEGIVRKGKVEEIREGDFVLCRNCKPLVDVFFQLLDQGKKAYIVGKEMEKGLLSVLGCCDSSDEREVALGKLTTLKSKVLLELKSKGISKPENHPKFEILSEKLDILYILFNKFDNTYDVEQFIKKVFDDENRRGVVLTTIHKAKGRENDRVFIIETYEGKKLIPSSYAVTKDQKVQERNLQFVSISRAKKELVYLNI